MQQYQGYTDSQTWQAWQESWAVVYGNVSLALLLSFLFSVAAAAVVYLLPPVVGSPRADNLKDEEDSLKGSGQQFPDRRKSVKDSSYYDESSGISQARIDAISNMRKEAGGCIFARGPGGSRRPLQEDKEPEIEDPPPPHRLSPYYQRKENEAKTEQLGTIHRLMQEQQEKFGDTSLDDLRDQMKLYTK